MSNENLEFNLTEPEDIYGTLRKLVLMGKPVTVHIDGGIDTYSTVITETDLKSRSFFMDKIYPYSGNDLIRAGHRFSIECDTDGVYIKFRMTGRLMFQPQKGQYRAEFPESLLYLQRRNAYRVNIPLSHDIRLRLQMSDQEGDLTGTLVDLSSSGFKAQFKGNAKKRIQEQGLFSVARLRFNRKHDMDCSLKAHHAELTERNDTQVGFEFISVSGTAQRYIDKLVSELQWEERIRREVSQEPQDSDEAPV